MNLSELVPLLQLSIGPMIVISGVGLLLLSMTNRYGRVIDRSRHLSEVLRGPGADRGDQIRIQLDVLMRRARVLRWSITLSVISVLMVALIIIGLFLLALFKGGNASIIAVLFVACMLALIASLVLLIQDIQLSLRAVYVEVGVTDA